MEGGRGGGSKFELFMLHLTKRFMIKIARMTLKCFSKFVKVKAIMLQ